MGAVSGNWYERVGQDWSGMQGGCCGVGGAVFGNDGGWGVGLRAGLECDAGVGWVGAVLGMMGWGSWSVMQGWGGGGGGAVLGMMGWGSWSVMQGGGGGGAMLGMMGWGSWSVMQGWGWGGVGAVLCMMGWGSWSVMQGWCCGVGWMGGCSLGYDGVGRIGMWCREGVVGWLWQPWV